MRVLEPVQSTSPKKQHPSITLQGNRPHKQQKSMKEDARDPSFFNFFSGTWEKRLFGRLIAGYVAFGCILVVQAVRLLTKRYLPSSVVPPPPLFKADNDRFNAEQLSIIF